MRHGPALPVGEGIRSDAERPLSVEGRRQVERIARQLLRSGVRPARILSSPLTRAVETARLMRACAAPGVEAEERPTLRPGSGVQKVWRLLGEKPAAESVLVVGHQPDLGGMLQALFSRPVPADLENFPPAMVCGFSVTDMSVPTASFLWVYRPG